MEECALNGTDPINKLLNEMDPRPKKYLRRKKYNYEQRVEDSSDDEAPTDKNFQTEEWNGMNFQKREISMNVSMDVEIQPFQSQTDIKQQMQFSEDDNNDPDTETESMAEMNQQWDYYYLNRAMNGCELSDENQSDIEETLTLKRDVDFLNTIRY